MTGAAVQLEDVDLSKIPLDKPTLDYLHENNVQIPQSEYDDEGNLVESGSILAPESAYTLTEVPAGEDGSAPVGDNIITKFNYNSETGEFTPVYYQMNLKQTEYGYPELGGEVKEYSISNEDIGLNYEVKYHINADRIAPPGVINNSDVDCDFIDYSIEDYGSFQGGAIRNFNVVGNVSGDFVNNYIQSLGAGGGNEPRAFGAAIYNSEKVGNISGNFIGNFVDATYASAGGAIYNSGNLGNITGNFIGNYANSVSNRNSYTSNAIGGAIMNDGKITDITANFIGNYTNSNTTTTNSYNTPGGGAIANSGEINNILGDFIGNYAIANKLDTAGGAIYNTGRISNIIGDFIANSANIGGAIYNSGSIGNITGNFFNNYADDGGAVYNDINGVIDNITGNFSGNVTDSNFYRGGQNNIYNRGTIKSINANFINSSYGITNQSQSRDEIAYIGNINTNFINNKGNLIHNHFYSNIDTINGKFINNTGDALIINLNSDNLEYASINSITGDFIDNNGLIIDNQGYTGTIDGNFNNNSEGSRSDGLIFNSGELGSIKGSFSNNDGTAIYNAYYWNAGPATIRLIDANFTNNANGAIRTGRGNIEQISGNFTGNHTSTYGGAIYSSASIGNGHYGFRYSDVMEISQGATTVKNITTGETITYYNNVDTDKLAEHLAQGKKIICNYFDDVTYEVSNSDWQKQKENIEWHIENGTYTYTNPLENFTLSEDDFAKGGGIINAVFNDNYAYSQNENTAGGAIYNSGVIGLVNRGELTGGIINSSFFNNYASSENGTAKGGAIYSTTNLNIIAKDGGQSVFSGNYTESKGVKSHNGIYLAEYQTLQHATSILSINTQNVITEEKSYSVLPTLTLSASTNGTIKIEDTIDGDVGTVITTRTIADLIPSGYFQDVFDITTAEELLEYAKSEENTSWYIVEGMSDEEILKNILQEGSLFTSNEQIISETNTSSNSYTLNITGDETGTVILNNDVTAHKYDDDGNVTAQAPVNISLENTNLYLGARDNIFDGNNLTLKSGMLSMINGGAGVSALNTFTVTGDTKFVADVDLANQTMDRITADTYGEHTGNLNVVGMNLLSDAPQDRDTTEIFFAETGLMDNVVNGTGELPDSYQTAYTPIYKYNVGYETREDDGGYFIFTRGDKIPTTPGGSTGGGSTGNPSDAFNPAVLATPVGNLAAGQAAMNEAFKYVFEHADAFTQLPSMERYAKINANKYALSTDFNDNLQSYADQLHNNAVWFRPYTTFETMNIKNGPKVDAITYGSLVGFDGDFKEMKNGWSRVFTGYAGYMGSSLNYSGVDTTMNGGLLGFTETFYKGNFWTAITASAGASVGESHTMYGKEDYTSLLAGVGSKTGYNFEFKDGKFIIQPIMFLSYTFVNTFDYKNAAGVSIESDPLHTIQLNPSVRFIANLKGGWQPYASVGMVWNLMNESKVTANNVKLPEMSVKPYVEYGVGVQRNWADKFTAFLQAMIRNGGRNGVALTGGFRFMLGFDDKDNDKPKVKKEIKSL